MTGPFSLRARDLRRLAGEGTPMTTDDEGRPVGDVATNLVETARSTTGAWSVVGAVDDGWRYVADEEKSEERGGVVQFQSKDATVFQSNLSCALELQIGVFY